MDKLRQRLRDDAEQIDVVVSDELQHRIDASLRSVSPHQVSSHQVSPQQGSDRTPPRRAAAFWWASSLTGLVAASAAMVFLNTNSDENIRRPDSHALPSAETAAMRPPVAWNVQPAMLTSPLEEELAALQADLEKAQQYVKSEIGL